MAKRADRPRPRYAPAWVREMPDREAHALAGRLVRESRAADLTHRQDWLLDRLLHDLRWRRSEDLRLRAFPCSCWLCIPPDWT